MRISEYTEHKYMGDTVECLMGSSYMKIEDCIAIHKTMQTQMQSMGEILTEDGDIEVLDYQPFWPCILTSPVNYDKLCDFTKYSFPHFRGEEEDNTVLWTLCAISLSSNVIWMNFTEGISTEND